MGGVLIACPMQKEASALASALAGRRVLATGLRIRRTVPALLKAFRSDLPSLLVFTGSAGQLDLKLEMGDIVLPERWRLGDGPGFEADPSTIARLRTEGVETCAWGLTLERAVMKADQRDALFRSTQARIYDSVTAAVMRVAQTSEVPCIAPKIVASTVNSGLMTFWNRLDRHILPLAAYLNRLLGILEKETRNLGSKIQ
jgi:nucleoside phosphorylase